MKLQPRLAALARRWLEVPSMAEHRRVSGRVVEHSMLFCGLALERTGAAPAEDLDQALDLASRTGAPVPVIECTRANFHSTVRL